MIDFKRLSLVALFVVLFIVGSYTVVPIGPVPIVLTNLFIFLSILLLDATLSLAATAVYIILGALGLPVFSLGRGGISVILGPTGGYIAGFLVCVLVGNLLKKVLGKNLTSYILITSVAAIAIYPLGLFWLKNSIGETWSWGKTLSIGCYPFLLGDMLKAVLAAILAKMSSPYFRDNL